LYNWHLELIVHLIKAYTIWSLNFSSDCIIFQDQESMICYINLVG